MEPQVGRGKFRRRAALWAHDVRYAVPGGRRWPRCRRLAQLSIRVTHVRRGNDVRAVRLLTGAANHIEPYAEAVPHGVAVSAPTAWARSFGRAHGAAQR